MDLPDWPDGTAAVLSTGGGAPHAIPVSTAVRSGPATIHLVLSQRRESLARLRAEPRCALTVMAAGDVAFTAHAAASVVEEGERVAYVRLDVDAVQDHRHPTFEIDGGVAWRWTDADAERADRENRAALRQLD